MNFPGTGVIATVDVEEIGNRVVTTVHVRDDLGNEGLGAALKHPGDEHDEQVGVDVATARALRSLAADIDPYA